MKKVIFILVFIYSSLSFSQENSFWNNVKYGSGFNASFGANSSAISISPTVAYSFNDEFYLGFGGTYSYSKRNGNSFNAIGPKALVMYLPIKFIEFSAILEHIYVTQKNNTITSKYNYPSLKIGGAYKSGVFSFGIQYDVLHEDGKSLNPSGFSPFVRVLF